MWRRSVKLVVLMDLFSISQTMAFLLQLTAQTNTNTRASYSTKPRSPALKASPSPKSGPVDMASSSGDKKSSSLLFLPPPPKKDLPSESSGKLQQKRTKQKKTDKSLDELQWLNWLPSPMEQKIARKTR
jgi:hypothetical protein